PREWLPEDEGHDAALLLFPALFFHSSSPPFGLLRRNHRGRYLAHFPYKKLFFNKFSHRKNFLTSPAEDSSGGMQTINVFIGVMKGEQKNKHPASLPDN
ncbi:MAG: hypothetical protein ACTSWF_04990, partial [Candidatus Freyarchaeota archaeon]